MKVIQNVMRQLVKMVTLFNLGDVKIEDIKTSEVETEEINEEE